MRILTWNVNLLGSCLNYHPFSQMEKRNVEGLLDELHADILCFQEHKTRRDKLEKDMACPGPYDAFWTFNRKNTGYSGVCTYVDSRVCVPLKAEEGITGLLLDDKGGTMKSPWTPEERIGDYGEIDELDFDDEVDGTAFDPKRLDVEGRAVVCDFGLFVLFNLYCPNETNDARRPFKMNFLKVLQHRVRTLQKSGREVIIAGDINIMRAPIDSGEGGIKTSAEQHYEHPARVILNDWCAPKGPMVDVVRESWPDREDMFTCWNTKLDARSANYGSRIDLILCTPGLRPWIKGGDIQAKVYGSDHCPVYIDLHDSITMEDGTIQYLRDMLNPPDRPPTTAVCYPTDPPRIAPEPPRFATKFYDNFSGRQKTLKSFFSGAVKRPSEPKDDLSAADKDNGPPSPVKSDVVTSSPGTVSAPVAAPAPDPITTPFGIARVAFNVIDSRAGPSRPKPVDLTEETNNNSVLPPKKRTKSGGQAKLSSFFNPPPSAKRKSSNDVPTLANGADKRFETPSPSLPQTQQSNSARTASFDPDEDALIAQAIAEADEEKASQRAEKNAQAAPIWANVFAKKLPPLCSVHQRPCKDYIVKIPGPNKGKRFWLCSLPVGAGYDTGRSKRPRQDVNPEYRCDFFLWDKANSRKEAPTVSKSS
ncbi:Endonuclease/exonuclease/phosphatase [Kockovaella imperatae]|uniref:DNA-(apurinic or apyrimidinic site) endonuclease 2 n=1 Tax=Kockovaella imperatae TaxID=4999 RepID=A0A1Y1URE4_9TREE|nr:Endonuclease/exonuclease/phosphatase [Kockovaella imperatae]ORX40638.1 Endonuclease/exonuclease/phosphatase [Kockovaella imperatae]